MATSPASSGRPEKSSGPLESNAGVQLKAQTQEQAEDGVGESRCSKRQRTSSVWDYFTRENVNGVWKAKCIWCDGRLRLSGETKNVKDTEILLIHLDFCTYKNIGGWKTQTKWRSAGDEQRKISAESDVSDQEVARKALYSMFLLHEYPLSIADHPGLRGFVGALKPFSEMINQNTIRKDILDHYETGKKKIHSYLEKTKCRVSVTAEFWTDNKNRRYMAVTGHFLDASWKPRRCILRFLYVPCPRTSDVLCEALCKCIQSWDLDRRLSTVNIDNHSMNDALIPLIEAKIGPSNLLLGGKMLHMGCCARSLNSVVKDGLEVIWTEIGRIRDSIGYCLATPKRYEKFEEAAQLQQVELTENLCLDCKTKWNSTYTMLRVGLLYKNVFDRMKEIDNHFTSCPTAEDWEFASLVYDILELFHSLNEMFSGAKYVTANIFLLKICEIKLEMQKRLVCGEPVFEKMSAAMIEQFDKYWSDFYDFMALATILDPRGKTVTLHFICGVLFGKENAEYHVGKSCDFLYELMNEYKKVHSEEEAKSSRAFGSSIADKKLSSMFEDFVAFMKAQKEETSKSELDRYLAEGNLCYKNKEFDILGWWHMGGYGFPTLRMIARDIFAIPITVSSESALSTGGGGRVLSGHCSRLTPKILEPLICSQDWLRDELQGEEGMRTSNMLGRH
ncbi:hypothetical protein ACP70R_021209 [Stipagrostis hirtigluma subsp. patula]